jgi:hypothetical protein
MHIVVGSKGAMCNKEGVSRQDEVTWIRSSLNIDSLIGSGGRDAKNMFTYGNGNWAL